MRAPNRLLLVLAGLALAPLGACATGDPWPELEPAPVTYSLTPPHPHANLPETTPETTADAEPPAIASDLPLEPAGILRQSPGRQTPGSAWEASRRRIERDFDSFTQEQRARVDTQAERAQQTRLRLERQDQLRIDQAERRRTEQRYRLEDDVFYRRQQLQQH